MVTPWKTPPNFKYFGWFLSAADDDWTVVVHTLRKAQKKWARLLRVLVRKGSDGHASGLLYVVLVQAVLMYESEMWVIYPRIRRKLDGFHYRAVHRLMGQHTRKKKCGTLGLPPLAEDMVEEGTSPDAITQTYNTLKPLPCLGAPAPIIALSPLYLGVASLPYTVP